jgi:hypothetical protein
MAHDTGSTETLQEFQKRVSEEEYACSDLFTGLSLNLDEESIPLILNHIDCFVSHSRGNRSIKYLVLDPHAYSSYDDEVWDKVGQAVGNLQGLEKLHISNGKCHFDDDDDDDADSYDSSESELIPSVSPLPASMNPVASISDWEKIPDWDRLARILSHMRQKVRVEITEHNVWSVGEVQALARAISHGHVNMTQFVSGNRIPHEATDALYSALATLPALEYVRLSSPPEDKITLANPESLTELLRAPSMRYAYFREFDFTSALCQSTANAFVEGTTITKLELYDCSFPGEGSAAVLANGLCRNTSLTLSERSSSFNNALCCALAAVLTSNSTLQRLDLKWDGVYDDDVQNDWAPLFLALGKNIGLKNLKVYGFRRSIDELLCIAMIDGLGPNENLERLVLEDVLLFDDNAALWSRAFSFLRTNKALKSLVINLVQCCVTKVCLSTFRLDIVTMLQDNTSLESLTVRNCNRFQIKADEYFALVTAVQHNTKLKDFKLGNSRRALYLKDNENKQMASLLKKNYALESLPDISPVGDVGTILHLNAAGRRYLIEDGYSISKGVDVLSRVSNDIDCVFFHLLENPRLCDRSAVEIVSSTGESNSNPTVSSGGGGGKREQGGVHQSKESRRRLA